MKKNDLIIANYEAAQVEGRTKWCPRKGIYKILSVHDVILLGHPVVIANVKWKLKKSDSYSDYVSFTLQMEFISSQSLSSALELVSREIIIQKACFHPQGFFEIKWKLLPLPEPTLDEFNIYLANSGYQELFYDLEDYEIQ